MRLQPFLVRVLCLLLFSAASPLPLGAFSGAGQRNRPGNRIPAYDTILYNKMQWREIGPYRAGRSVAVAGHTAQPSTFYFGATGGGVWKTTDAGDSWTNVSDSSLKLGIVGALAVAESDPNVIYAGTGEACIRGNAMPGEGIYKSDDAGKSWKCIGLREAQTISKIRVHPKDDNLVYAAVLGHPFGPNKERGVYRSKDGGTHWQQVLWKNDSTGAVDLAIDPLNPRVLYAALWQAYRNPWSMSSGGAGSGLWKSTDGGDTWRDCSRNKGLPAGAVLGKIGIAASPARPDRLWASIEADDGGLFLSDDGGKSWTKMTDDRRIRQRAWYYSHIYADPKNPDGVYVLNVQFFKSIDAGRTLSALPVPHGDNHDLWIDPEEPRRMIEANDGGATVTLNGGQTWSKEDVPTAQFYHVALDNDFPYNVYGAQQDNSTVRIPSRTTGFGISERDWFRVGGGESGFVEPDPRDPNVVYAGSYDGLLTRYDHRTDQEQDISPWPDNPMGAGARDAKYRFQWTYPIAASRHDSGVLYVTANVVFKTTNEGMSWEVISPDLTRNDTSTLGSSGGPITKDNTSVEYYGTIFAFAESPVDRNVLWTGSDDGLVHVSRDGGKTWTNVTPRDIPGFSMMSIIDASPHDAATAYLAANRYKLDDFRPYIFRTTDFGKSWNKIVEGIPGNEFTHVVREDPNRKGLLYAGTERGIYVSFNAGGRWQSLRCNLPVTPVHDLAVQAREKDLVAATHGRSFWILDDLTPLYQLGDQAVKSDAFLFKPRETYRIGGYSFDRPGLALGKNPPNGAVVYYELMNKPGRNDSVKLDFLDESGKLIRSFRHREEEKASPGGTAEASSGGGGGGGAAAADEGPNVPADSGMNRFVWDLHYPDATRLPGAILWAGSLQGPLAPPGAYQVRLSVGDRSWTQPLEIRRDPRLKSTLADLKEQFDFSMKIRDKISALHDAVITIRDIRSQTNDLVGRLEKTPAKDSVKNSARNVNDRLKAVEEEIVQVKIKSGQDALNYPIKLNDKLSGILGVVQSADTRPTRQSYEVYAELAGRADRQLDAFRQILQTDLAAFNHVVRKFDIPAVIVKSTEVQLGLH